MPRRTTVRAVGVLASLACVLAGGTAVPAYAQSRSFQDPSCDVTRYEGYYNSAGYSSVKAVIPDTCEAVDLVSVRVHYGPHRLRLRLDYSTLEHLDSFGVLALFDSGDADRMTNFKLQYSHSGTQSAVRLPGGKPLCPLASASLDEANKILRFSANSRCLRGHPHRIRMKLKTYTADVTGYSYEDCPIDDPNSQPCFVTWRDDLHDFDKWTGRYVHKA